MQREMKKSVLCLKYKRAFDWNKNLFLENGTESQTKKNILQIVITLCAILNYFLHLDCNCNRKFVRTTIFQSLMSHVALQSVVCTLHNNAFMRHIQNAICFHTHIHTLSTTAIQPFSQYFFSSFCCHSIFYLVFFFASDEVERKI